MRSLILACAAVAVVQSAPASAAPAAAPAAEPTIDEAVRDAKALLEDPRNQKLVTEVMSTLSGALLDLKVGEIRAAAEGRPVKPEEKSLTVRDIGRRDDPQFEARMRDGIAKAGPTLAQSMKALSATVPALAKAVEGLAKTFDRLDANLPDPAYPKR